jgi:hypothetical protein
VRVRLSGEDDRRRWCGLNALVLAREGKRRDEVLPEDEADAASTS